MSNYIKPADDRNIVIAAGLIKNGQVVVFPTETVYGLGADASNDLAVAKLFQIKGRSQKKPIQILVLNLEMAKEYAVFSKNAEKLANEFWPGPLTIVLPMRENSSISQLISPGSGNIGIRVPANKHALNLLRALGKPIAATSANFSGRESSVNAIEAAGVAGSLVPMILDGGRCAIGQSSTVIDMTTNPPIILREGALPIEELNEYLPRAAKPAAIL